VPGRTEALALACWRDVGPRSRLITTFCREVHPCRKSPASSYTSKRESFRAPALTATYIWAYAGEFSIDSKEDDFESGAGRSYVLGDGADVRNADVNDPRKQLLFTENVDQFPVYIRFQPRSRSDNWQLQRADVRFNNALSPEWDTFSFVVKDPQEGI
jgi:hypothetical protein